MNVCLLIEEYDQNSYTNKRGEKASPFSSIVGLYEDREKAEREKEQMEEYNKKNSKQSESFSYIIEERPLL